MWSRLSKWQLRRYVSGYHHPSVTKSKTTRAKAIIRQVHRRYTIHIATVRSITRTLHHISCSGSGMLVYVKAMSNRVKMPYSIMPISAGKSHLYGFVSLFLLIISCNHADHPPFFFFAITTFMKLH